MAERKTVFDPLAELMAYYAGKKESKAHVDVSTLTVEERLTQRIIDGDQIGIDADLTKALESHDPLKIINTFLLDGMKVVGELFGSGQMQLPFVLQSAETMKTAVAFLEPFMEKSEDNAKGVMVLATVKGDVHDIGKNLVDIILTNNGYRVINLGIKIPIDRMLEAAEEHKANAIGMSGLLVKSTLIMKENLQLMNGRGIDIPVVLGGAALTRRYVEQDLRAIYGPNVAYAEDAFAGLRYMEILATGGAVADVPARVVAESGNGAAAAGGDARKRATERGLVRFHPAVDEEELAALAEILDLPADDLVSLPIGELTIAELHERVVGGGRARRVAADLYELTSIAMLSEQWKAGAGIDLVRTIRAAVRAEHPGAEIFTLVDPNDAVMVRFYRTLGFDTVEMEDPRAAGAGDALAAFTVREGIEPMILFSKSAAAFESEQSGSALGVAMHLQSEQTRDADFPTAVEDYETDMNVKKLRVVSDVDRTLPVPAAPFLGSRVVENIALEKVYEYINEVALIRGQWQVKKGNRTAEEYKRELDTIVYPKLEEMKLRAKRERLLDPKVIYGYYPCRADYNTLVVYKPKGMTEEEARGEWPATPMDEEHLEEWVRFDFPRQAHGRHLCIADFFRPAESGEFDVVGFQIVTMGSRASEYGAELFRNNNYADYLYFHGLSVESAEALAEYWHRSVRIELGIAGDDAPDVRRLFSQGYRGSRYSFGYPACPDLEEQTKVFQLLDPSRIGVALSDEFMLEPEQSTSAIVVHHPAAKYFNVREV
jgi:cobalamin-dependent methionine synthase I/N-acetylglutamate synthase-like GNAT family acetyltransferase